jgi:hypothetical protein
MKLKLAFLVVVVVCFGRCASADQITTGNLSFTCVFTPTCLNPTSGSFAYDNTTNQFLSVNLTWDGITFIGPNSTWAGQQEAMFLELIGSSSMPLSWGAVCVTSAGSVPPCDELGFGLGDVELGVRRVVSTPEDNVSGGGTVTTPEPNPLLLLVFGLTGLVLLSLHRNQIQAA